MEKSDKYAVNQNGDLIQYTDKPGEFEPYRIVYEIQERGGDGYTYTMTKVSKYIYNKW